MNKLMLHGLACASLVLALPQAALAHGGQYRGPGDVVPPNAGGGGGRTPGPSGPSTPGPSSPSAPAPAGPTTPGPAAPGAPTTGGPAGPGPAAGPKTGPRGAQIGTDLSKWQFWWEFNKDPFINLKDAIHAPETVTGSDEFFMGSTRRVASKDTAKPSESDIKETILPAIKRALDTTDNRDINSSCIIALAKIGMDHIGDFNILKVFQDNLSKPDQEIRETAALAMGISGLPEAVPMLVALAGDKEDARKWCSRSQVDDRTRSFACYGLGLIAWRNNVDIKIKCFEALRTVLADKEIRDRNMRVAAINGISLLNVKKENRDPKEEKLLNDALDALNAFQAIKAGRGTDMIKSHVPPAVAKLIGRGTSDLHNFYKDKYAKDLENKKGAEDTHRSAALALGQLCVPEKADAKYSKILFKYFENGREQQARYFALLALGQIGGDEKPVDNRSVLMNELRKGRKALDRPWAALALGVLNHNKFESSTSATPDALVGHEMQKQLQEIKEPQARGAVAIGLGLCRYKEASSALLDMLAKYGSAQDELAGYICVGLALMNEQRAKEDIHNVVRGAVRRPDLLKQAAIALGKLGDKTVTKTLTDMLQDKEPNLAKLSAIASALSFIGDRRTIIPLRTMLFNEELTPLSRAFAAVALGGVADKEKLPWNSKISRNMNYRAAVETLTQSGTGVLDIL